MKTIYVLCVIEDEMWEGDVSIMTNIIESEDELIEEFATYTVGGDLFSEANAHRLFVEHELEQTCVRQLLIPIEISESTDKVHILAYYGYEKAPGTKHHKVQFSVSEDLTLLEYKFQQLTGINPQDEESAREEYSITNSPYYSSDEGIPFAFISTYDIATRCQIDTYPSDANYPYHADYIGESVKFERTSLM